MTLGYLVYLTKSFYLNQSGNFAKFQLLILYRWMLTAVILVYLRDYSLIQSALMLMLSVLTQCTQLAMNPYPCPLKQAVTLTNEFLNSLYLYSLLLVSIDSRDSNSQTQSYLLLGVTLTAITLNLAVLLFKVGRWAVRAFNRIRMSRVKKEAIEEVI